MGTASEVCFGGNGLRGRRSIDFVLEKIWYSVFSTSLFSLTLAAAARRRRRKNQIATAMMQTIRMTAMAIPAFAPGLRPELDAVHE